MSLIPRWRYMTNEAKALTKRIAISAAVVFMVLLVFRGQVVWAVLALIELLPAVILLWVWKGVKR